MTYKIKISKEAEFDLDEAYEWYKAQVNELGSEFIRVVDEWLRNNIKIIQSIE